MSQDAKRSGFNPQEQSVASPTETKAPENTTQVRERKEHESQDSSISQHKYEGARYGRQTHQGSCRNNETQPRRSFAAVDGRTNCPDCGGDIAPPSDGSQHCTECGLVLSSDVVDRGPEWRAFNDQQSKNKSRVGMPLTNTRHDKGLTTIIGYGSNSDSLSDRQRKRIGRLRKLNKQTQAKSSGERSLRQALGEIKRLTSELDLPDNVEETASVIFRRAREENLLMGRSIEGVATAATYTASRQAGIPEKLGSFVELSRVSERRVERAFREISRELELEIQPPDVMDYLPRVVSHLDVPSAIEQKATELLKDGISENVHSGKDPASLAAASVYAAISLVETAVNETAPTPSCTIPELDRHWSVTQSEVADVANVCELTVRTHYRDLLTAHGVDPTIVSPSRSVSSTPYSVDEGVSEKFTAEADTNEDGRGPVDTVRDSGAQDNLEGSESEVSSDETEHTESTAPSTEQPANSERQHSGDTRRGRETRHEGDVVDAVENESDSVMASGTQTESPNGSTSSGTSKPVDPSHDGISCSEGVSEAVAEQGGDEESSRPERSLSELVLSGSETHRQSGSKQTVEDSHLHQILTAKTAEEAQNVGDEEEAQFITTSQAPGPPNRTESTSHLIPAD